MAEMNVVTSPKVAGYVNPSHNNSLAARIKRDEEELENMINPEGEDEQSSSAESSPAPKKKDASAEVEAESEVENLSKEEETYKKRYGDLRKHMNELTSKIKALEEAPATGNVTPPKSPEEVDAWMRKYPDVAAIVEAIADKKATERFASADERLRRIDEMTEQADRDKAHNEIRAVHADFDDLLDSDKFHTWASEQPKWVQDALYENADDPKSVVKVITLYKYENGLDVKGKKSSEKNAASAILTKRTRSELAADEQEGSYRESAVNKMSMHEYEKKQDEIMDSIRKGKFIYDVTGAAR